MFQRLVNFQHLCHALCHFVVEFILSEPGEERGVYSESPLGHMFLKGFSAFRKDSGNYQNILSDVFQCKACARLFPPSVEMPLEARLGRKTRGEDYYTRLWLQQPEQPGDSGWWPGCLETGSLAGSHPGAAAPGHRLRA